MRVLVAGATGVLGRALLPQLVAAGYDTLGLARSPQKLLVVSSLGATPIQGDVLDAAAMRRVMREYRPQALVNLATAIPLKLRIQPGDWVLNDRIRTEGTRNLLEAGQEADVQQFIQESVGYVCQPRGDAWIDEEAPHNIHPFLRATLAMEDIVRATTLPAATLLRFGALGSADSWHIQQSIIALQRGILPIIGNGDAFISTIHAQDAALAILCALADPQSAGGQIFNVVDNEPARMRNVWSYAAQALKAPLPKHVPPFVAKLAVGALTLEVLAASYRMSNAKIRRALGFTPRFPTYRQTWDQIAREAAGGEFAPSAVLE